MADMATVSSRTEEKLSHLNGVVPHLHYPIEAFNPIEILANMQSGTRPVADKKTMHEAELNTRTFANYQNVISHYLSIDGHGKNEPGIIAKALATNALEVFGVISLA